MSEPAVARSGDQPVKAVVVGAEIRYHGEFVEGEVALRGFDELLVGEGGRLIGRADGLALTPVAFATAVWLRPRSTTSGLRAC